MKAHCMWFWLLIFLLCIGTSIAQEPVKDPAPIDQGKHRVMGAYTINMTQVLVDENGRPIKDEYMQEPDDPQCLKCRPLTLGAAVAHALFAALPSEKDVSGEQKFSRGTLALRIENDPTAKLTASEVTVIKDLVGKLYSSIIITRVFPLIDPNAGPPPVSLK
jgi:hypothetical protein